MTYVALLRGINVGGNNKVEMSRLKQLCIDLGYTSVSTYINSGNVIFNSENATPIQLASAIEQAIRTVFGFEVKVVVVEQSAIRQIAQQVHSEWVNNSTDQKCDILFLWPDIDSPQVLQKLNLKPDIDDVLYFPGAVVWRVFRKNYGKSGMNKLFGTEVYKKSTARNINTVRKLAALL